jgi:crotonobetainyl-CoA:carnitine CoA-transferase CaiB-like acyl-CoA transferase
VLDLTRILAGPVATRFLAGYGAQVLRLDPPGWDEPVVAPEITLGKKRARLDLRNPEGRTVFERLLGEADVLVHGYRSDALENLGFGDVRRREINPGLVDVCLDAYGWTGEWRRRRGFDSLVQMSSGIAEAGMRITGKSMPTPLPVQALDHSTGYILAAAVLRGLVRRIDSGMGSNTHASLARTAAMLTQHSSPRKRTSENLRNELPGDYNNEIERTPWGPARRLLAPYAIEGTRTYWALPAGNLGDSLPAW